MEKKDFVVLLASNDKLEKKIDERLAFIKKVVSFVSKLLLDHGRITKRYEGRYNTHVVRVLEGFAEFSFKCSTGESEMGGNHIDVYDAKSRVCLLRVYWSTRSSFDDCKVKLFEKDEGWVKNLKNAINHKDELLKKYQCREKTAEEQRRQRQVEEQRQESLKQRAEELGL